MMKKIFILAAAVLAAGFSGCRYDDADLWNELNEQEARLTALEQKVTSLNTDIQSIQTIVSALQAQDMITGITPLADGSGYTIAFSKHSPITIKNGQNGADGADGETPAIAVAAEGGIYYWTIDGAFLTDGAGNKIPVTGNNGQDGITPQLRINSTTMEWEISTNGGTTWITTGVRATGPQGPQGPAGTAGDSFFQSVNADNANYVIFTLADGTTFSVPRLVAPSLIFSQSTYEFEANGTVNSLDFTTTGDIATIGIASAIPTGWSVSVDAVNHQLLFSSNVYGVLPVLVVATSSNGGSASYWITLTAVAEVVENLADLVTALTTASAGDVIVLGAGIYVATAPIVLSEDVTLKAAAGTAPVIQTNGTFPAAIEVNAATVTIDGITIQQTADVVTGQLAMIHLTGNVSGTVIQNSTFIGSYDLDANDGQVVRAILSDVGQSLTIIGNTFINVRQPAYIEGSATIKNNYTEGTKGWVITQNSIVDMTGNTFGTNAVDIAIINNGLTDQSNYTTSRTQELYTLNGNAHVENQVVANLTDQYAAYNSINKDGSTYLWVNPNYVQ